MEKSDRQRYNDALHRMQTGVALKAYSDSTEIQPKHLRVGINSTFVTDAAVAKLLIEKGVFTIEEYTKALADQMEIEAKSYETWAKDETGFSNLRLA